MHECKYGIVVPKNNAEFWHTKRSANVDRDAKSIKDLESRGWQVLIVWECQTRTPDDLEERLRNFLR